MKARCDLAPDMHASIDRRKHRARRPGVVLLACGLALAALAAPAPGSTPAWAAARRSDPPPRFAVRGLPPWDRLKMRLGPGPASPHVGEIPAGAAGVIGTGRQRRLGKAVWREVEFQGVRGWVLARFLAAETRRPEIAVAVAAEKQVFHQDLICVGHTPAWKLIVDRDGSAGGSAAFGGGVLNDVHAAPATPGKAARSWELVLEDAQGVAVVTLALRETHSCNDPAGKDVYTYEVTTRQPNGTILTGCCNRLGKAPRLLLEQPRLQAASAVRPSRR